MKIVRDGLLFLDEDHSIDTQHTLDSGAILHLHVDILTDQYLASQRDLRQEIFAEMIEKLGTADADELSTVFEQQLQAANRQLTQFAEQRAGSPKFKFTGFAQLIDERTLLSSLIGESSLMIFRDQSLLYTLNNEQNQDPKIDAFADVVEGDVEIFDTIFYSSVHSTSVFDHQDLEKIEELLQKNKEESLNFIQKTIVERRDESACSFVLAFSVVGGESDKKPKKKLGKKLSQKFHTWKVFSKFVPRYRVNKLALSLVITILFVLVIFYQVFNQIVVQNQANQIVSQDGSILDVSLDDLKKQIQFFQTLDPSSDEKSQIYNQIMQKLDALEAENRRIEDVTQLKKIVQSEYSRGFNILTVTDRSQFDQPGSRAQTRILELTNSELNGIGTPLSIHGSRELNLAGTDGAILGIINDNSRGIPIDFGFDADIDACTPNLNRDGLYCHDSQSIFNVTNQGLETVITSDDAGFPTDITDLQVYGQANIYAFHDIARTAGGAEGSKIYTRFRSNAGSQTQFQEGAPHTIAAITTGTRDLSSGRSSVEIDGSFRLRSRADRAPFQLRRDAGSALFVREVPLRGGLQTDDAFSSDVEIITSFQSKYVVFFDRANQEISVFDSEPTKANSTTNRSFSLRYLFKFDFNLPAETIVDAHIPPSAGNQPELFLLTESAIYKINLTSFIDSLLQNRELQPLSTL